MSKENKKIMKEKANVETSINYLPISEIRSNTIILKDWGLRWVIKVQGINLDLKSYEEQRGVIEQYKNFLNWVNFPIQIHIRSTYLDLSDYIEYIEGKLWSLTNDVLKWHGEKYREFLTKLNESQWLLYAKEFYIIVPYYPLDDKKKVRKSAIEKFLAALSKVESAEKIITNLRFHRKNKKKLDSRCQLIVEKLREIGIQSEKLETSDIVGLMFETYNPAAHKKQSETVK